MKIKNRKLGGFISFKTGIEKKILSFLLCTFLYLFFFYESSNCLFLLLKIFNKRLLLSIKKKKKIIVGLSRANS